MIDILRDRGSPVRDDDAEPPAATIYLPDTGGPIRTLFGMGHKHIFAINRDPKTNHPNPTEGMTEREMAMRCATDPDVAAYQTQPFRTELMSGGALVSWIPDVWILYRDGRLEIVEVKPDFASLGDAAYVAKLRAAFTLFSACGWRGRVRYRKEIMGTPDRQVNTAVLYCDRAAHIDEAHRAAYRRLLADQPSLAFGDLVEALDSKRPMQSQAVAHRLICTGRVWADLDQLLTEDSPVLVRPRASVAHPLRTFW